MKVHVISHQVVFYQATPRKHGDVFEVDGLKLQQYLEKGLVAPVEEDAPPAPAPAPARVADPEPAHDVPKKQGKALRTAKHK